MTTPATPPSHATGSRLWISTLIRRFPELLEELTPTMGGPLRERPGPAGQGGGAAPVRLYVSDAVRDITDGVHELEEAVRERLGLRPVPAAPVPVRLRRVAGLVDRIGSDPVLAAHVEDETRRMARRAARVLGDAEQMVRLPGRCPHCDSVSLRAFPERAEVRCVNPACRHLLDPATATATAADSATDSAADMAPESAADSATGTEAPRHA